MITPIWESFETEADQQAIKRIGLFRQDMNMKLRNNEAIINNFDLDPKTADLENLRLILMHIKSEREKISSIHQKLVDEKHIAKRQLTIKEICGEKNFTITTYSGFNAFV